MRYIKYVYEKDITGVKKIDLSELGMYNILKGRFLELVVQQVMSKFNNESLKGELFGKEEDIIAPCFMFADTRYAKGENTNLFQIDVFGKILNQETVWLCECKYRLTKMGMGEVKKLEAAKEAFLKQEAQEKEPHLVPKIKLWYVSTGGFTDEALDYLVRKEDVYYSNYKGINEIFRRYGGGFDIPVFYKE